MRRIMQRRYKPGAVAYVNGKPVRVVRQVLFNRPAYRVRAVWLRAHGPIQEWVIDGVYLSDDPKQRISLLGVSNQLVAKVNSIAA